MMQIAWDCPQTSLCDLIAQLLPCTCLKEWRITKFLGEGADAYVFGCRSRKTNRSGALKIQLVPRTTEGIAKEVRAHNKFSEIGLSPPILSRSTLIKNRRKLFFLNMDRIDGTLYNWLSQRRSKKALNLLVEKLFAIIAVMRRKGITHGDLHSENIGFIFTRASAPGRIQIIDHRYASTKGALTELEIVQFMRTLHACYSPDFPTDTRHHLLDRCQAEARRIYGYDISRSLQYLDSRFGTLRRKLRRMS